MNEQELKDLYNDLKAMRESLNFSIEQRGFVIEQYQLFKDQLDLNNRIVAKKQAKVLEIEDKLKKAGIYDSNEQVNN